MEARSLLDSLSGPVIPVSVVDRRDDAVPLAAALLCGGLSALEVSLRTPAGYEAIRRIKAAFPDAVIGAGTVCSEQAYRRAVEVGADFIVAPGATETLYRTAQAFPVPFLPGAVTGSEVLSALDRAQNLVLDPDAVCQATEARLWSRQVRDPDTGGHWHVEGLREDGALLLRQGARTTSWTRWGGRSDGNL